MAKFTWPLHSHVLIVPVFKGVCYHYKSAVGWYGSAISIFYDPKKNEAVENTMGTSTGTPQSIAGVTQQGIENYFKAPADGFLFVPKLSSLTSLVGIDEYTLARYADIDDFYCRTVSEEVYATYGVATSERHLTIPAAPGLKVKILGYLPVDTTKAVKTEALVQFWLQDSFLGAANIEIGVSGVGTVTDPKKGYNIKLTNSDGKKLQLKVGDLNASNKWGLKAYYLEGTNTRDSGSNAVWRAIRQSRRPFVGPSSLLSSGSTAYDVNWYDRPFSTDGHPIELYVGGALYGVYTLRTRAENPDYMMVDKNKKHIKISPDYGLHGSYASWANFDFTYWDLVTPEIKGYTEGDATIPDTTVQASITRFGKFFTDLNAGNITLTDEVLSQYLDRESVVDFFLFSQLVGNNDGIRNNVSVCTWDGNVWGFYPYDLDRTAGLDWGESKLDPTSNTIAQDESLNKLIAFLQADITARYKALRSSGLISADNLMRFYAKYANPISKAVYDLDATYWNVANNDYQNMGFIYN